MCERSSEARQIAVEAVFQLECGHEYMKMLASSLHVIKAQLKDQKGFEHLCEMANMAAFNADDWRNIIDAEREALEDRLSAIENEGAQCN
jgi:hypothetical protein